MDKLVLSFVLFLTVPFVLSQKEDDKLSAKDFVESNKIIDTDEERENEADNTTKNAIDLSKEMNGMMAIYARVNFRDLPPESLDPMPTLQKFFPEMAALLPIKTADDGSRQKRAPATPPPTQGGGLGNFLVQAMCAQQQNPMMNSMVNPMMNNLSPLMGMFGRRRRGALETQRRQQNAFNPFNSMSQAFGRRRFTPTQPPMMGQMNQMNPMNNYFNYLMMMQQLQQMQNPVAANNPAGGTTGSQTGSQTAPGGGGNAPSPAGGGLDLNSIMAQAACMQMASNQMPLHPPEPGTAPATGMGTGAMNPMMSMMSLFGR